MWSRKNALKDLITIREILDKHKVRFILVYGTCLGFVRDKNFIEWDDDMDLAVIDNVPIETRLKITDDLIKEGFFSQDICWSIKDPKEILPTDDKGWRCFGEEYVGHGKSGIITFQRYVHMTIFFFEEIEDELVCKPIKGCLPVMSTPKRFFKKLDKIKNKGYEYNIPGPVGEYLESVYTNWEQKSEEHAGVWSDDKTTEEVKKYIKEKI